MNQDSYYNYRRRLISGLPGPLPGPPKEPDTGPRQRRVDQYKKLLQRQRYRSSTIKTYTCYFSQFLDDFEGRNPEKITREEINDYILHLINEHDISSSQQNQRINSIKFYYEKVLGFKKEYYYLDRPRKEIKLPTILSTDEVHRLLDCTTNLKHKCILMTIYSGGLRRSELINLRISDIDSARKLIKVRSAKGKKDRYTILSNTLLTHLREYYVKDRPKTWLFEGQGGRQYSATSIEKIMHTAVSRAGIIKHVTPHSLRHSFATHLMEQGTNQRYIQELLGHESSKTTEIYTRVASQLSRILNPLDHSNDTTDQNFMTPGDTKVNTAVKVTEVNNDHTAVNTPEVTKDHTAVTTTDTPSGNFKIINNTTVKTTGNSTDDVNNHMEKMIPYSYNLYSFHDIARKVKNLLKMVTAKHNR